MSAQTSVESGSAGQPGAAGARSEPSRLRSFMRRPGVMHALIVWAIVVVAIPASRIVSPAFPSLNQIENIAVLGAFLGVAAFGVGLVILSGGFDLSVSSVITASGVFAGAYVQNGGSTALGIVLALLVAAGIGACSGIGVAYLRIPPFIMTLATGTIVSGALLGLNAGHPSRPAPQALRDFFGTGRLLGIPDTIWFFIGFVIVAVVLQQLTTHGRRIYAVGNGELVATLSGLPVRAVTAGVYAIAGLCYGIAGIMLTGYSSGANLSLGNDYLLPAIAAVVVGGVSIKGGRGTYVGVVGGTMLLTTVGNDISATSLAEGWKQVLYGAIVLGALVLSLGSGESGGGRLGLRRRLRRQGGLGVGPLRERPEPVGPGRAGPGS
ncbi:MAG TPA: ABC transporter permease [Baekduia sp.]|nr:ABC transporter permease [Baekduia sp.]